MRLWFPGGSGGRGGADITKGSPHVNAASSLSPPPGYFQKLAFHFQSWRHNPLSEPRTSLAPYWCLPEATSLLLGLFLQAQAFRTHSRVFTNGLARVAAPQKRGSAPRSPQRGATGPPAEADLGDTPTGTHSPVQLPPAPKLLSRCPAPAASLAHLPPLLRPGPPLPPAPTTTREGRPDLLVDTCPVYS